MDDDDITDDFTMLGWTWLELNSLGYDEDTGKVNAVEGFEIWKLKLSSRFRVGVNEFKSSTYAAFKKALAELETLGAIERVGSVGERKLARVKWRPTKVGDAWWHAIGLDLHGPERPKDLRRGIAQPPPMKKWINLATVNGPTRRLIEAKIFSGQWEIAIRDASDKKTGGSSK